MVLIVVTGIVAACHLAGFLLSLAAGGGGPEGLAREGRGPVSTEEADRLIRKMKKAEALLLDAVCRFKGYTKHHPLRRQFRQTLKAMIAHRQGRKPTKAQMDSARLIAVFERVRADMKAAGLEEPTPEQHGRWVDAVLDYHLARR